ncbi:MAG: autotransporter outer membrane beta-barrel domain-containing protein [Acidaminococcaceae bacterium]|nr:autotransporter outer membrane beta-barrel domain-containing protein [Acidaminococcaceae bacterium]
MKKHLLRKILLNVVMGGVLLLPNLLATGVEAADFKYKIDDGAEQTWDGSANLLIYTGNKLEVWGEGAVSSNYISCGYNVGYGTIDGKTVIFRSGEVARVHGGYSWYGGATGNRVTISGGSVEYVYGAFNYGCIATGNTVTISGGSVEYVYGGFSTYGVATENTVTVSGGLVNYVYGGFCNNSDGRTDNNIVNINGGTVTDEVYGGYSNGGAVTGNKVIVSGGDLSNAEVYGYNGDASSHSNNTLQIENSVTIKEIHNFENISFVLPTITENKTLLNLINAFSVTGENVSVNLGDNDISTLNTYDVTLADNVSGAFDVTYYDKNNNATGYAEKFNLASAGAMKIGEGAEMHVVSDLTTDAGELLGKQSWLFVDSGKNLTFVGGNLKKNIAGTGTAEFNGTVSVADGVNLGMATNNVNGTLDVAGHIAASNINFKSGSTLKVDGTKITNTAAVTEIISATVESGAKLYVSNAVKDTTYKILRTLAGSGLNVQSWTDDSTMGDGFRASYGLLVDTDNIVNNGSEFSIRFKEDPLAISNLDIRNIVTNLPAESKAKEWLDAVSVNQSGTDALKNSINTMANVSQLANVQNGALTVSNLSMDSAFDHMSVFSRPVSYTSSGRVNLRNISTDSKNYNIDTIPIGKAKDIQPINGTKENSQASAEYTINRYNNRSTQRQNTRMYHEDEDKTVWATYIHSKQEIKDMKTGRLKQDSTVKQNGVAAGADLWKSDKGFGGIAVTYADGDVESVQKASTVKNDIDHYGANIYHRQDIGKFSVQIDAGYGKSKNDIKMETTGAENITLKPKTEAYSAGLKLEEQIEVSSKTNIVPYLGVRYTYMETKQTDSNIDLTYGETKQDMCSVPAGLSLRHTMPFSDGFKIITTLEGGYIFNVGDRKGTQKLLYGDVTDTISYNIVDKGQYFLKGAIQAVGENMAMEFGYHYTKSDKVKDNKWYVNANFDF